MDERLNVLLVVLDGARPDHLSCAGYGRETTPFLDQVAREGVRFAQAVTSAPWTLPAHAAMFTGLFSATHGATSEHPVLDAKHRVLAEHLKAAGYRTAAFCTNPWVSPESGLGRGFDRFHTQRGGRLTGRAAHYARRASDRVLGRSDAGARRSNRAVLEWIGASQEPFFAFVHYNETHLPLQPPAPYDRLFMPREFDGARVRAVQQAGDSGRRGGAAMQAEEVAIVRALYDGALRYADMRLKELSDALAAQGRWDRTLLVVTADHGEDLGEHGGLGHTGAMYDTMLRVPLLVRCPRRVPRGFVVEEFAQPIDLLPSILGLLALPPPEAAVHGRPLIADGHATTGPDFVIAERFRPERGAGRRLPSGEKSSDDVRQKAIRTRREKFVWHSDEGNELYDLVRDGGEQQNLIERESERAELLRRRLFDWLASVERDESDGQPIAADAPAQRQRD